MHKNEREREREVSRYYSQSLARRMWPGKGVEAVSAESIFRWLYMFIALLLLLSHAYTHIPTKQRRRKCKFSIGEHLRRVLAYEFRSDEKNRKNSSRKWSMKYAQLESDSLESIHLTRTIRQFYI